MKAKFKVEQLVRFKNSTGTAVWKVTSVARTMTSHPGTWYVCALLGAQEPVSCTVCGPDLEAVDPGTALGLVARSA